MQSRGDSICYFQAAWLASEQCKGSCWLWPQLVMKTLFSFLFQTMPPGWANCRKRKLFARHNKLNPVHLVNDQAHISQCSLCSWCFLGGDKGTEAVSEIRIRFRAPEWLCYSSLVPEQARCWCSKELLHETSMYNLSSSCPHLWFSQFHGSNWLHLRRLRTLPRFVEAIIKWLI